MSERAVAMAAFLAGGLAMALFVLTADRTWMRLACWWEERRLDREFRRIVQGRDLDLLLTHLLIDEGAYDGDPGDGLLGDELVLLANELRFAEAFDAAEAAFDEVLTILGPPPGWGPLDLGDEPLEDGDER